MAQEKDTVLRVVNENGEIVATIGAGDRIVRKETTDYLNETIPWGQDMHFVKMYDYFSDVALKLSGGAAIVSIKLSAYIAYGSNLLCKRSMNNPLNNDDIVEITGYTKRQVGRIMDELVKEKIFARTKVGLSYQYYANPYIFSKGSRINKTLEAMFRNYPHERLKDEN